MQVTRILEDEIGVSRFQDLDIALHDRGTIGRISDPVPVSELMFRETPADYHFDWHPAPRRQYIVLLDGEIAITTGAGETRTFGGGEILLVEDTTGRGHLTRHVQQTMRRSLFISLPEDSP